MDRLNALRGTPSPNATAPSPTTSQKDAAEANDFFAALAGGADNITSRRRAPAKAAAPVEKTPARSFVALPSPSTSQKDDQEAQDFFSTLLQGSQPTPAATPAARPAPPPTPMSISPPPPQQTQQQRRVSFREPVDAPPPPLPRTVSEDNETPPKETDDVLKLVDSWGADASPDDEAARLAQLRADEERRRASEAHAESARKVALEEAAARAEAEVSGLRRVATASPEEGSRLTERRRARREATVWSAGGSSSSDADAATTPAPTAPKRTDSAEARDFFAALGAPVAEPAASPAPEAAPVEPEAPEAEVPAPEVAEAPAMPPLPETPVAEASSTKERTPDGARVVTTCAGAVARAPPPVEPSEIPGAVALPGLAAPKPIIPAADAPPRRVAPQAKPAPAMRRGPTIAKPFTFGASRRQTVAFREPVSPPLAERLAKADAAVPSRWRKEPAPRTKRRQTLTQPASPALATKNLRQKPPPPQKKEEVCTDFKARELDQRILGDAGGCVGVPVVASRPCTAPAPPRLHATRAKPIAMSRDEYELSKPAFKARECPGGMARFAFLRPFPSTPEPLPRWRRRRHAIGAIDTQQHRPSTAPAQQPRHTKHQRKTMSRPFSARPAPPQKFEVAKSSKPLTVAQTPPMPGLVRHQQATQRFEQKKRNEAKALKRRQSRGLVLRERDSNTQNLDARFEKRKAYDAELKRRQALRTVQAAQEADEAKRLEEETLRRERMTPAAKGGMQFVASAKRYGRHGSLTNPDDLVEETPLAGALVDYGTPQHAESDVYAATPVGEAAEGRIAEAVVEAC